MVKIILKKKAKAGAIPPKSFPAQQPNLVQTISQAPKPKKTNAANLDQFEVSEELAFKAAKYTTKAVAAILNESPKTVRGYVKAGLVRCHHKPGAKRPTYKFSESNLQTLLQNLKHKQVPACPSISTPKAHTGSMTSKSTETDFTALFPIQASKPRLKLGKPKSASKSKLAKTLN